MRIDVEEGNQVYSSINGVLYDKAGDKFLANGKGKMYKNKAEVKNLTAKSGRKVTLYAQWKKNK